VILLAGVPDPLRLCDQHYRHEFFRGARVIRSRSGASLLASAVDLTMRNTRRYGGYIVTWHGAHFVDWQARIQSRRAEGHASGSTLDIGQYRRAAGLRLQSGKNYTSERMSSKYGDNKPLMMLYPERRFFQTTSNPDDGGHLFDLA